MVIVAVAHDVIDAVGLRIGYLRQVRVAGACRRSAAAATAITVDVGVGCLVALWIGHGEHLAVGVVGEHGARIALGTSRTTWKREALLGDGCRVAPIWVASLVVVGIRFSDAIAGAVVADHCGWEVDDMRRESSVGLGSFPQERTGHGSGRNAIGTTR